MIDFDLINKELKKATENFNNQLKKEIDKLDDDEKENINNLWNELNLAIKNKDLKQIDKIKSKYLNGSKS